MSEKLPLAGGLFSIENAYTKSDLQPLFELSKLSAKWWTGWEEDNLHRHNTCWGFYNSPIQEYAGYYKPVSKESPLERLSKVVEQKGSVVCLVLGTNDNPLQEFQRTANQDGRTQSVVITACLKDRRTQEEKEKETQNGRFVIEGTIGSEEFFTTLATLLQELHKTEVIAEPFVDVMISKMMGGWRTLPFRTCLPDIFHRTTSDFAVVSGKLTAEEQHEAQAIQDQYASLPPVKKDVLNMGYRIWLAQSFEALLNPREHSIFGEIPDDLEALVSREVRSFVRPYRRQNSQSEIAMDFEPPVEEVGVMGVFRLDKHAN